MRPFDARTTGDRERAAMEALRALRARVMESHSLDDAALDEALDAIVPPFPIKLQVQTTTRCNAACEMCPYPAVTAEPDFAHEELPGSIYRELLAQIAGRGVERLSLFLMNEPLLDRRMPALVAEARRALPEVVIGLYTNGSPLTGDLARRLAEAGLDELCISVHGFDAKTYESVMQGLSFVRLRRRLDEVLALRAAGSLGRMRVHVITGDTPGLRASLAAAPPAVRELLLIKAFSNERAVTGTHRAEGPIAEADRARAAEVAPPCQRPFVKLYVLATGECVLCNVDWRRTVVLGRIGDGEDGRIERIWRGPRYREIRRAHLRGLLPPGGPCARCDYPAVVDE